MTVSIEVENVTKTFTMQYHRTLKQMAVATVRRLPLQEKFLARQRRVLHRRAGRVHRPDGPQRLRQEHPAQADQRRDAARRGHGPHPRPDRRPDRHRRRLPPAADRPGEPLPQRRDPRHERGRDQAQVRRDRRVRRHRQVPRHPGLALLLRHVRPARASPSPSTSTPTSSWPTRCSRWGTGRSRRSAWRRCRRSAQQGTTIFYVSHATASVRSMCDRVLVLESGRLKYDSKTTRTAAWTARSGTCSTTTPTDDEEHADEELGAEV